MKWSTKGRPPNIGAAACLKLQLPILAMDFPEVAGAHPGTVNVALDLGVLVLGYDHRTAPIKWTQDYPAEVFDFVRIDLEAGDRKTLAWLYVAHASPHRQNLRSHEIVTPAFFAIADGERCKLHISRSCVSVPYVPVPITIVL